MQGGARDGGFSLTAYVTIALLENGVNNQPAVEYLEKHLDSVSEDPYSLAVATYALQLAGSSKAKHALQLLEKHRIPEPGQLFKKGQKKMRNELISFGFVISVEKSDFL